MLRSFVRSISRYYTSSSADTSLIIKRTSSKMTEDTFPLIKPWPITEKRENESEDNKQEKNFCKEVKVKKKKFAILMAYNGRGYYGLQRNANSSFKTIEEDLLVALKNINVLNDEEFKYQQLVKFQRAARTDKGVSALRQVISLQMQEGVTAEEINQHLPEQIRVLAIRRVTRSFNSKNSCDGRTYSYTCPTFAFAPIDTSSLEEFRITEEILQQLHKNMQCYIGCHNFHNYTSGRRGMDPSCNRYIISMEYKKPVIEDGLELITILIRGQSFMLHQIRKMIAVLISIARGYLKPDIFEETYQAESKLDLPVAPGLGLLLEQVHYDKYDSKFGNDGFHEKMNFEEIETLVENFRSKFIYPTVVKEEREEKSMLTWLDVLAMHFEEQKLKRREDHVIEDNISKDQSNDRCPSINDDSNTADCDQENPNKSSSMA